MTTPVPVSFQLELLPRGPKGDPGTPGINGPTSRLFFNLTTDSWSQLISRLSIEPPGAEVFFSGHGHIPAGTWDLNYSRWYGQGMELSELLSDPTIGGSIVIDNGCVFTNVAVHWLNSGLIIDNNAITPPCTFTSSRAVYVSGDCTIWSRRGPLFKLNGTDIHFALYLEHGSFMIVPSILSDMTGDYESIDGGTAGSNSITVRLGTSQASLTHDTLRGSAPAYINVNSAAAQWDTFDALTQPNLSAPPTPAIHNLSTNIAYTPDDTAFWGGTDPATIAEAIDRIAAVVGFTVPIP